MAEIHDTRVARHNGEATLHLHCRFDQETSRQPVVVFSHGFTVDGAESHRIFLRMAARYNEIGVATVNLDYYGCGYSDGDFTDFSLSNAAADLRTVLDWLQEQPFADPSRVVIHGQSLGTAIATVVGAERGDIRGYVFWNFSADLSRRYRKLLGEELLVAGHTWVKDKGYLVTRKLIDDIDGYDIMALMSGWRSPTLFVSAGSDTVGEPELAERACQTIGELGSRVLIPGANHSFKCQPDLEDEAVKASVVWVAEVLEL